MKASLKANLAVAFAAILMMAGALGPPGVGHASVILSNNLSTPLLTTSPDATGGYDGNYDALGNYSLNFGIYNQVANSFSTGIGANQAYVLDQVIVDVYANSLGSGALNLYVYSNTGGTPGANGVPNTQVATLSFSGSSFPTAPNSDGSALMTTFTPSTPVTLAANSYYWIVLAPTGIPVVSGGAVTGGTSPGKVFWGIPIDDSGSGPGLQPGFAVWFYLTPGSPWTFSGPDAGYRMEIVADPVPAPATLVLLGSGLLGLAGLRWRIKI